MKSKEKRKHWNMPVTIVAVDGLQALGKIGRVHKVYADGDLRVIVEGQTWTFNPACCSAAPHAEQDLNNTMSSHQREEPSSTGA